MRLTGSSQDQWRSEDVASTGPPDHGIDIMVGATVSHYRIEAELGRGGMGVVFRGTIHICNGESHSRS
jgi:hypothetical protein